MTNPRSVPGEVGARDLADPTSLAGGGGEAHSRAASPTDALLVLRLMIGMALLRGGVFATSAEDDVERSLE
jgi:hypothetical protein